MKTFAQQIVNLLCFAFIVMLSNKQLIGNLPAPEDQIAKASATSNKSCLSSIAVNCHDRIIDDTKSQQIDSIWIEISKDDFNQYKANYHPVYYIDSNNTITGTNLRFEQHCKDICVPYLLDSISGERAALPTEYDQGIIDVLFSLSGQQLIVYSSYDGPDYINFYTHRAEIALFDFDVHKSLESLKLNFVYYSDDWSMEELVWIDDSKIAVKAYADAIRLSESSLHYYYFFAELNK